MRPVQYFTDEYLAQCQQMTAQQILQFLEDFRLLFSAQNTEKLQKTNATLDHDTNTPQ